MPDLSLPKTILSAVDKNIGASGLIQSSPQNLTLYNPAVTLRLLGGAAPHDQLLGPDRGILSDWFFWGVEVNVTGTWIPLVPLSSDFTVIGTNSSGTFVVRTMRVSTGSYSGILSILYKSTSAGSLNWDLQFTANSSGCYRLVYSWSSISALHNLQPLSKKFESMYSFSKYILSWADVPTRFNMTGAINAGVFILSIDLGMIPQGSNVLIDPSVVGSSFLSATAYTFQRKVFYEPIGGYYWAFYYNGNDFVWSNSANGTKWSTPQAVPPGVNIGGAEVPDVFNYGQTVIIASGSTSGCGPLYTCSATVWLPYYVGTISGSTVTWGSMQVADYRSRTCTVQFPWQTCSVTMRIEYVDVVRSSTGAWSFSYILYSTSTGNDIGICGTTTDIAATVDYRGRGPTLCGVSEAGSVVVASNFLGQVRLFWTQYGYLVSMRYDGNSAGPLEQLGTVSSSLTFSAVSDDDYGIHVIFQASDLTTTYAHLSPVSGASWTSEQNIFPGITQPATLTIDRSTGELYAFAINGTSIIMKAKPPVDAWADGSMSFQIDNRLNPNYLDSNFASSSATSANQILLLWTEGDIFHMPNATFASIPIQTVWSPYSSPRDPWTGSGLVPYGQYFANLGEYVSPSSGMLTVRQTDLSVPGRGLNLEFTRVYVEPFSFTSNVVFYDPNPWVPMGDGWQFNFPWMSSVSTPSAIHLKDGQGYRIPSSFWTGSTATFENHQGENFRLARAAGGNITLYDKVGTSYSFGTNHMLNTITDSTGNNTITFSYSSNRVSCVTDTVGRIFAFTYSSGLLSTIAQVTGTCASPGNAIRTVSYANNGQSLNSVTDPAGRTTFFSYNATGSSTVAPWLLSQIRYPTLWLTNYTYTPVLLGSQTYAYRVNMEKTGPSASSPVKQFQYSYSNPVGDQVTGASIAAFNGTQLASYTKYAFSFLGDTRNVTDANGIFLSGTQQLFGVNGQIPKEIVLVSDGHGNIGSYTNFFSYDFWGNQIYSRRAISSSSNTYHDSFNGYYNDGLPLSFNVFQDSFSQLNGTFSDNSWLTYNGTWRVRNGIYNGTSPVFNPTQQEGFFAWTNITSPSASMTASIYITTRMASSNQRSRIDRPLPWHWAEKMGSRYP